VNAKAILERFVPSGVPKSATAKAVAALGGASAFGQIVTIVAAPVLSRLYSPAAFGSVAVLMALVNIIAGVSALRYELALPLPDDEHTALNVLALTGFLTALFTAVSLILIFSPGVWLMERLGAPSAAGILWLIPLGVLSSGLYTVVSTWALRDKAYGTLARTRLIQGVSGTATSVGLGAVGLSPVGLAAGTLVTQAAGITMLLRLLGAARLGEAWRSSLAELRAVAVRYRHFALYTSWQTLLSVIGQQSTPLLLSFFFGSVVTGWFSVAQRVCVLPSIVVGASVSQVLFAEAADRRGDAAGLARLTAKVVVGLAVIGIPSFVALALFGPPLFAVVFGARWREAGVYAAILAPWLGVTLFASALSILPMVLERQRMAFLLTAGNTALVSAAVVLGGVLHSPLFALALLSVVGTVLAAVYLVWCLRLARVRFRLLRSTLAKLSLVTLAPLAGAWLLGVGKGDMLKAVVASAALALTLTLSVAIAARATRAEIS